MTPMRAINRYWQAYLGSPEQRYRAAMMRAIAICQPNVFTGEKASRTNALRCIRTFERVNGFDFNPFLELHLDRIRGMAWHEGFHRAMRKCFADIQKRQVTQPTKE